MCLATYLGVLTLVSLTITHTSRPRLRPPTDRKIDPGETEPIMVHQAMGQGVAGKFVDIIAHDDEICISYVSKCASIRACACVLLG